MKNSAGSERPGCIPARPGARPRELPLLKIHDRQRGAAAAPAPGTPPIERAGAVKIWHLYVVRTVDGLLYAGISTDVRRRFREHAAQGRRAARFLLAHKPHELVFSLALGDRGLALRVEYHFKRLPKGVKERIVETGRLEFDGCTGRVRWPE